MKKREYVARCYIDISEEEVLNYAIKARGCKDKDEFFKMGYTITEVDWRLCAEDEFWNSYDEIEFLEETEE